MGCEQTYEDSGLALKADMVAFTGRLAEGRKLSEQAVASAERAGSSEVAATYEAASSLREALFSQPVEAKQAAVRALERSKGRDVEFGAALALAFAGDTAAALSLENDLVKRFPEDTIIRFNYLPSIRAQLALDRGNTSVSIEILDAARPYELGWPTTGTFIPALYPVYVRGQAYLASHDGVKAVAEFQKILDHRGVVIEAPISPLAHLGIARAYVLQGETVKARAAYRDFLTLWKDADPDIPILQQAKAEYERLQ